MSLLGNENYISSKFALFYSKPLEKVKEVGVVNMKGRKHNGKKSWIIIDLLQKINERDC